MPLPKPKTMRMQILVNLSGFFVLLLAGYYLFAQIDIVPDSLGPLGYLDDVIILFVITMFTIRFVSRFRTRYSKTASAYKELFRRGEIFKVFTKPRTWFIMLVLAAAFTYAFWALDVIPDGVPYLGHVDDALVAIGAVVTLLRTSNWGPKQ